MQIQGSSVQEAFYWSNQKTFFRQQYETLLTGCIRVNKCIFVLKLISSIDNGLHLWYFDIKYRLIWILTSFTVEEPKKLYEESQDKNYTNQVKHEGSIAGHCRFLSSKQWSSVSFPRQKNKRSSVVTPLDQDDFTSKIISFHNSYFSLNDFFYPFLFERLYG